MYGPPSPETKLLFLHKINWTLEIELSYSNRNKLTIVKSLSKSDTFATSCILWEVNKNIERLFITGDLGMLWASWYFPSGSDGKEFTGNAGDLGSIPALGSSPGEGNSNPLKYSCLENLMDRRAWWATVHGVMKSQTWLSN